MKGVETDSNIFYKANGWKEKKKNPHIFPQPLKQQEEEENTKNRQPAVKKQKQNTVPYRTKW